MGIIISLEKTNPQKYKMYSKKYKEYLTVTLRRLQQFTDKGILPNGEIVNNNYLYNSEHLYRYVAAIELKNSGHTLIQVKKILEGLHLDEVIKRFLEFEKLGPKKAIDEGNLLKKTDLPEKLKKIGREEGRVLRSQWIKFAITKWCHLDIKKKELMKLTNEDIDTLAIALKDTLSVTSKMKNIDRSIG